MARSRKSSRISATRASRSSSPRSRRKTTSKENPPERAGVGVVVRKSLIAVAAALLCLAGCGKKEDAADAKAGHIRVGLVAKSLGNGFFDAVNKGAQEAAKEIDAE